ncbi:Uncharacterised protein [Bordetella pertussis]|nr:Uncharacterised protein [Bordetella pertussis]CFO11500.1 Uncharacterised protein [Bordetella pertussis]CFO80974.1 Uncharacterised protein [Bordetella pertussis]CPI68769.1 Uncharacterised protein [Bordetella pertussis]CPM28171.1 Uncharacterised protein [Bordetella pertussis]
MMNWPSTPISTSRGRCSTSRKSSFDRVRPMPNMIRPSRGTMYCLSHLKCSGE